MMGFKLRGILYVEKCINKLINNFKSIIEILLCFNMSVGFIKIRGLIFILDIY